MTFSFTGRNEADLTNLTQVEDLFAKVKPTLVIHLAARVGGLFANMKDKVGFFEDNLAMNSNIIKTSHKFGV